MSVYVFGYGALIHLHKIKEIERPEKKKICPVMVKGLKRSLNVGGANHLVFGVKDVKTAVCNGILFKVNAAELTKLQEREKLYTMKTLAKERIEFPYKNKKCVSLTAADQIICFYPQRTFVLTKKQLLISTLAPASSAYINNCKAGARAIGEMFFQDFLDTTTLPV
jgi:hypothetical protein